MNFGKYTAEKKLGKGAMGEVFYGIHPNLDIPVAIKTLTKLLVDDEQFVERFIREAKMAAQLRHENAILIYDADNDEENHFIVMEYIAGGDLNDLLENKGPLKEKEALKITRCVASALQAAAKYGIIHRDIKPDNIMLTEDGTPKLADLGIARQNADGQVNTTMTGVIVGTPSYLAPEQAHDSKKVDARADIYALGCTLFKMLSGRCPYEGTTALSVMMKHINEPVPDIRTFVPEVSEQTSFLLQNMMAKNPDDRPSSAEELINLIDDLKNLPPKNSPKETSPQKEITVSGKAFTLTLALAGLILVLALLIAFLPGKTSPEISQNTVETVSEVESPPAVEETNERIQISDLGIEMIPVKAATFMMGAQEGEPQSQADETLHRVTISEDYYLSKYEISVAAWKVFTEASSYETVSETRGWSSYYDNRGSWEHRVNSVNWRNINLEDDDAISMITYEDALEFCQWLSNRERSAGRLPAGFEYTLPTEAQWENACRAGSTTPYANGKTPDQLGWTRENSANRVRKRGLKEPNDWGFYDMHGNVWEFCLDRSEGENYFDVRTNVYRDNVTDPLSTVGDRSVYRGGSYPDRAADYCRSASRGHGPVTYSCNNHGFRLCLSKVRD